MTSAPQFLVRPEVLSGGSAVLTGSELHHVRVRRLHIGSEILLSDGRGHQRHGIIVAMDRHRAVISLTADVPAQRESPVQLILAQAALKADKMDVVVEKATELGVSEIVVFSCARSIGRASPARQARWQRLVRSAAKQCQRSTVPSIAGPISFDQVLTRSEPLRLLFWEGHPVRKLSELHGAAQIQPAIIAVVGPEGGFSVAEAERASACGFQLVGLGPRTVRAETAAIVAVTLCQFLWGDLAGRPR